MDAIHFSIWLENVIIKFGFSQNYIEIVQDTTGYLNSRLLIANKELAINKMELSSVNLSSILLINNNRRIIWIYLNLSLNLFLVEEM